MVELERTLYMENTKAYLNNDGKEGERRAGLIQHRRSVLERRGQGSWVCHVSGLSRGRGASKKRRRGQQREVLLQLRQKRNDTVAEELVQSNRHNVSQEGDHRSEWLSQSERENHPLCRGEAQKPTERRGHPRRH